MFGLGWPELLLMLAIIVLLSSKKLFDDFIATTAFCFGCFHFYPRTASRCTHCGASRR